MLAEKTLFEVKNVVFTISFRGGRTDANFSGKCCGVERRGRGQGAVVVRANRGKGREGAEGAGERGWYIARYGDAGEEGRGGERHPPP